MILGGKDEVNEEDCDECEDDACEEDLNWERTGKLRLVAEDGIIVEGSTKPTSE